MSTCIIVANTFVQLAVVAAAARRKRVDAVRRPTAGGKRAAIACPAARRACHFAFHDFRLIAFCGIFDFAVLAEIAFARARCRDEHANERNGKKYRAHFFSKLQIF